MGGVGVSIVVYASSRGNWRTVMFNTSAPSGERNVSSLHRTLSRVEWRDVRK